MTHSLGLITTLFWRFGVYIGSHPNCSRVAVTSYGGKVHDYRRVVNTLFFNVVAWWPRDLWHLFTTSNHHVR